MKKHADLEGNSLLQTRIPEQVDQLETHKDVVPFGHSVHIRMPTGRIDELTKLKLRGKGTHGICLGAYVHSDGHPDASI